MVSTDRWYDGFLKMKINTLKRAAPEREREGGGRS
jgi:hypothetical protein